MQVLIVEPLSEHAIKRFSAAVKALNCEKSVLLLTPQSTLIKFAYLFDECLLLDSNIDETLEKLAGYHFNAVIPGGELSVYEADYIASKLKLPHNPLDSSICFRNKAKMRKLLAQNNISQPALYGEFSHPSELDSKNFTFPVVVKPVDDCGSINVSLCDNLEQLKRQTHTITQRKESDLKGISLAGKAIVEQAILGDEYSAEVAIKNNQIKHLSITKKHLSPLPHFDELGHDVGITNPELTDKCTSLIHQIKSAYQFNNGVLHVEFKYVEGELYVIECAARVAGGRIADLVEYQYGISLEAALIDSRANISTSFSLKAQSQPDMISIRFIYSDSDLKHLTSLKDIDIQQVEYRFKAPAEGKPKNAHYNRNGFVIFRKASDELTVHS